MLPAPTVLGPVPFRRSFGPAVQLITATIAVLSSVLYAAGPFQGVPDTLTIEKDKVTLFGSSSGSPIVFARNKGKWVGLGEGPYLDTDSNKLFVIARGLGGTEYNDFILLQNRIQDLLRESAQPLFPEIKQEDIKAGTLLDEFFTNVAGSDLSELNKRRAMIGGPLKGVTRYCWVEEGKLHVMWRYDTFGVTSLAERYAKSTNQPADQIRDYLPEYKALLAKAKRVISDPLK
jgi:hypothetical protein